MIRELKHKVVAFNISHLEIMAIDQSDINHVGLPEIQAKIESYEEHGNAAFTLVVEGRPILSGGIFFISRKVAQCWLVRSIYAKNYPNIVARVVKRQLLNLADTYDLHRLQTINRENREHDQWCEWLGFTWEGKLEKFTDDGQDANIYAMVL